MNRTRLSIDKGLEKNMSTFLGHVKRYWKQLAAVAIFAIASAIAFSVAFASQYDIVMNGRVEGPNSWTKGYHETWVARLPGLEESEIKWDNLKWESSDNNVVSVSAASGREVTLTAIGGGSATITVTYFDTDGTVLGEYEQNFMVKLEITNDRSNVRYQYGFVYFEQTDDTYQLSTNVVSSSKVKINWTSDNEQVATVDSNGIVTAGKKGGVATITGETENKDQRVEVTVIRRIETTTELQQMQPIKIGPNEFFNVYEDKDTGTKYTNAISTDQLIFGSQVGDKGEEYIVTDTTGYIKGVYAGRKSVYIYPNIDYASFDEKFASYTPEKFAAEFGASVLVRVDFGISNGKELTGAVGDTVALKVNTTKEDNKGVNWTSNNTSVATVDSDGLVTFKSSGEAIITATMDNPNLFPGETNHTAQIKVTVIDNFAVDFTSKQINVGDTFELSALVTDDTAKVTWTVDDLSVISYTESEESSRKITVEGLKKGKAKIKAIQEVNGVTKYAYCEVDVNEPVQSVVLFPTKIDITIGDSYPIVLTFEPERPDNMEVKWVSSNENVLTVSDSGVVKGVGGGDAVVSVITLDGIKVASCDVHVRVPVTGITLSKNMVETTLSAGNYQLSYTIAPEGDGVDTSVIWSSSNEDILTVDQNGFVTFVSPGNATVICQTNDIGTDGNNLLATCDFFISEPVTQVSLDFTDITLKLGDVFRLTAEILPLNATDKSVTWISSNTSVVTVDENGLLTAVGTGSAAVLVQSNDSGITAMCNINVYQPVETVDINYTEMSVRKGTVFWLYAKAGPDNAVNKTIIWSTSNPRIATVDESGMVTAVEPGECIITATSQDTGVFATCSLTVTEPVTGISLNYTDIAIYAGDKFALVPTVSPIDADNKAVTYLSSDTDIATVDENGIVTGLKGGECVILVTTVERGLVASCKVTVYEFVTSVTINEKDVKYINNGASKAFTVSVTPDSATNRGVIWSSSNTNVFRVSQRGVVTAVGLGTATITATAADGSGIFDTITLQSIKPVSTISVSPSYVTVIEGQSRQVTATISPSDATIKEIEWSSSNPEVAAVDYNGEITGVSAGICYVYAKSTDGNDIVGIVKVTVKKAVPATSIVINATSVNMFPGQTRPLSARVRPSNSTDNSMWVSSDTSVATVDSNGVVTARGQGNCIIYCVAESGVEDECEVNVLALNSTSITLEQYDNYILDIYGCTEKITWYTNNNRIATVDTNGKVIARGVGSTTIVARVNGKLLYCKVTVKKISK